MALNNYFVDNFDDIIIIFFILETERAMDLQHHVLTTDSTVFSKLICRYYFIIELHDGHLFS